MMLRRTTLIVGLAILAATSLTAQESQNPWIFSTYYQCDNTQEAVADRLVGELGEVFDAQVSSGNLMSWGWISHHVGGPWRRALYFVAADADKLLGARDAAIQEIQGAHAALGQAFNRICPVHEDYIWQNLAGSDAPGDLGEDRQQAGMSTYFVCDVSREDRADELLQTAIAPVLDEMVTQGLIGGWSWNAHRVGGDFRRLLVYEADDHPALIRATGRLNAQIDARAEKEGREFNAICNRHHDYMWDISSR